MKKVTHYLISLVVYAVIIVGAVLICYALNILNTSTSNPVTFILTMIAGKIVADIIVFAIEKVRNKNKKDK